MCYAGLDPTGIYRKIENDPLEERVSLLDAKQKIENLFSRDQIDTDIKSSQLEQLPC